MDEIAREASWLERTVGVRRLDDHRVLGVRGDDARAWLNGQVSNDLRGLAPGGSVYALVLNARGKVLADAYVLDRAAAGLALVVPADALGELVAHFDKYIIMEDVEIVPGEGTRIWSAQGPRAAELIRRAGLDGDAYPADRIGVGGMDVLLPASFPEDQLAEAARGLEGGAISTEAWELVAARRGVPSFGRDFGERSYPQEAGLRERAVSFTKGCYLGQEVVCTLENRGQLVRKLVQLALAPADRPTTAAAVESEDGVTIGDVTSAVVDGEHGRALAFAYVKRASAVAGARVRAGGRPATIERVLVTD